MLAAPNRVVVVALDNLKEKAVLESARVDVEELPVLDAVIEYAERTHAGELIGGDLESG